jgi:spermidine synthase
MRETFFPFFFFLGLVSVLGQVVILREIAALFYGNEMFYGLGLGSWLLFVGLGSFLGIKLKFLKSKPKILWLILLGDLISIPLLVIFLRLLIVNFVPLGELPNLYFAFLVLGLVLFPLCFCLGALFALGAIKKDVNQAYFWETIGFTTGGLLFAFVLATISFPHSLEKRFPGFLKLLIPNISKFCLRKMAVRKIIF